MIVVVQVGEAVIGGQPGLPARVRHARRDETPKRWRSCFRRRCACAVQCTSHLDATAHGGAAPESEELKQAEPDGGCSVRTTQPSTEWRAGGLATRASSSATHAMQCAAKKQQRGCGRRGKRKCRCLVAVAAAARGINLECGGCKQSQRQFGLTVSLSPAARSGLA